ncbi:MAG: hypothetical protein QM722_21365 [Piscinibacter sp.]
MADMVSRQAQMAGRFERRQRLAITRGQHAARFDPAGQLRQLCAADRRLQVGQPVVEAGLDEVHAGRAALHAVVAQTAQPRCQRVVVGRQDAALAGGQRLARVQREAADVAARAGEGPSLRARRSRRRHPR